METDCWEHFTKTINSSQNNKKFKSDVPAWEIWDAWVSTENWLTLRVVHAQILSLPPTRISKVTELECPGTGFQAHCVVFVCKTERILNCFAKSNETSQRPKMSCWQKDGKYGSCHTFFYSVFTGWVCEILVIFTLLTLRRQI